MKIIKKLISVLLILSIVFMLSYKVFAKPDEANYPVVFVAGYTSSRMWVNRGTDSEKQVWSQDIAGKVKEAVINELPSVICGAGSAVAGDWSKLFSTLDPYVSEVLEYLRMNDDGTSKYDVEVYPHSVADTRLDVLKSTGYLPDADALKAIGSAAGDRNVYCCTLDWRYGQLDCAAVLKNYIDDVLMSTGAEKVNLYGVSFGGQVAASYMQIYGGNAVNNAVLHSPALDGSSIVSQLLSGDDFKIAWKDALKLYQAYDKTETDYSELGGLIDSDFVNNGLKEFINHFLLDFFVNFGSVWDLVPSSDYQSLRDKLLSDGTHDAIVYKSNIYHSQIEENRKASFNALEESGVKIAIVAGYNYELVVGNGTDSDGVIDLSSTTGAKCAQLNKTLPDGYVGTVCSIDGHNHVSAFKEIDAGAGYLPERTWYVRDLLHGLGFLEEKISRLMTALLLTDEINDVYSSKDYPQFLTSQNRCQGVFCSFSSCSEGFITKYSTKLTLTNLSKKYSIKIDSVRAENCHLKFSYASSATLAPGESIEAEVYGKLPENDISSVNVKINYFVVKDKYDVEKSRTQEFVYSSGSLYSNILTADINSSPTIPESGKMTNNVFTFETLFARIVHVFLKILNSIF